MGWVDELKKRGPSAAAPGPGRPPGRRAPSLPRNIWWWFLGALLINFFITRFMVPPADEPILKLDNVIVTPHALCWTDECFAGNGAADIAAVKEIMHGRVPRGVVNREVLENAAWKKRLADLGARYGA